MIRVLPLFLLLVACAGSPVRVRITEMNDSGLELPVEGARVRAVMLGSNSVPLPINEETLAEMLTSQETVAVTDADGVARLSLMRSHAQLLEVEGPIDFSGGAAMRGRWVLPTEGGLARVGIANELRAVLID